MGIRPEFADIAIDYVAGGGGEVNDLFSSVIFPQAEFKFSEIDAATPVLTQSNGNKTLDPQQIFDISTYNPSLDPCTITNGRFGSSAGMGFGIFGIHVTSCGFYQRVEIDLDVDDFIVYLGINDPDGLNPAYYLILNKILKTLSFGTVTADGSTFTEIESFIVEIPSVAAKKDLLWQWDGNGRWKISWDSKEYIILDNSISIFSINNGHIPILIVNEPCVSNYDVGSSQGFNSVDKGDYLATGDGVDIIVPTGNDRGISYGNVNMSEVWLSTYQPSNLYVDQEYFDIIKKFNTAKISPIINVDTAPIVFIKNEFPGYVDDGYIRLGFSSIINDSSKINNVSSKNIGLQTFFIELDPQATPISPYDISDIETLGQASIDDGTLPYFEIYINDWNDGDISVFSTDFDNIISSLENITGPCWISIAANPVTYFSETNTIENWLLIQENFKTKLTDSNNENVAFVLSTPYDDFSTISLDTNLQYWDIINIQTVIEDNISIYQDSYSGFREWSLNNRAKVMLTISINFSLSPTSVDVIDWLDSFYDYAINSYNDNYESKLVALNYYEHYLDNAATPSSSVIPDPSSELTEFVSLVELGTSLLSSDGTQLRVSSNLIDELAFSSFGTAVAEVCQYSISKVFIWNDLNGYRGISGHNMTDYITMFNAVATEILNTPSIEIYGPNIRLGTSSSLSSYNGVSIDSRDMDALLEFIDGAQTATPTVFADGISFSGNFSSSDWVNIIEYIKDYTSMPIAITHFDDVTEDYYSKIDPIIGALGAVDLLLINGSKFTNLDILDITGTSWNFSANLIIPDPGASNTTLNFTYSEDILANPIISIVKDDEATPYSLLDNVPISGTSLSIGNLSNGIYSISIFGDTLKAGYATLRFAINSDNFEQKIISDTKYIEEY